MASGKAGKAPPHSLLGAEAGDLSRHGRLISAHGAHFLPRGAAPFHELDAPCKLRCGRCDLCGLRLRPHQGDHPLSPAPAEQIGA